MAGIAEILENTLFNLPALVFVCETCVVTLSTVRTIFLGKGMKFAAAGLGFIEVSIWLFAIGKVMQNLSRLDCAAAFAAGFSLGNFLGILIEKKLALGAVVVHATTMKDASGLIGLLRQAGFGATVQDGFGAREAVQVVSSVIPRRDMTRALGLVKKFDHDAFYWVHDLQLTAAQRRRSGERRQEAASIVPFLSIRGLAPKLTHRNAMKTRQQLRDPEPQDSVRAAQPL